MPLSPHTPPGTHIVVTWVTADIEEYVHHVILPQYRVSCAEILRKSYQFNPTLKIGKRFVLAEIRPCPISLSGYLCKLQGQPGDNGYALEHFDVAVLPKEIIDLLTAPPTGIDALREAFFEAADS